MIEGFIQLTSLPQDILCQKLTMLALSVHFLFNPFSLKSSKLYILEACICELFSLVFLFTNESQLGLFTSVDNAALLNARFSELSVP